MWGDDVLRAEKLRQLKNGETTVLVNCNVLVEGFDSWQVGAIVLARPTKSSSMFTQMIGRGLRLQDGTGNLLEATKAGMALQKTDCKVIDVVDCSRKCNLVTLPSLLGLNADFNLHGESITKAVEKLEEVQEQNPSVDFSTLTDLSEVKAHIEALDLFSEPYTPEVKEHSKLRWMQHADGTYSISIPEEEAIKEQYWRYRHEKLVLAQNQLEEWELSITSVDPEKTLGTFNTLSEAFQTADDVLLRCRASRIKLLQREAEWHSHPASEPSKKYLRSLSKKRAVFYCLCAGSTGTTGVCLTCNKPLGITAGQAALAITKLKNK